MHDVLSRSSLHTRDAVGRRIAVLRRWGGLLVVMSALLGPLFIAVSTSRLSQVSALASTEVEALVAGRSVVFPSGATGDWQRNGRYLYRPGPESRVWQGRYHGTGQGVCVELPAHYGDVLGAGWGAMGACFRILRMGDDHLLVDEAGHIHVLRESSPQEIAVSQ